MILDSTANYFRYRRHAANALTLVRSRRTHRPGQITKAILHNNHRLFLRGGTQDHSAFHEIFVLDVYRIASLLPAKETSLIWAETSDFFPPASPHWLDG